MTHPSKNNADTRAHVTNGSTEPNDRATRCLPEAQKDGREHPAAALRVKAPKNAPKVPRLALTKAEAAASLGVSVDFLEAWVLPDLRVIRKGRLVLIPLRELERWVERNAAVTLAS